MEKNWRLPYDYQRLMEHDKWIKKIPFLNFPKDWEVQITPPFAGAVVRFRIRSKGNEVSVYLDCYNRLGYFGEPYWEIYPHDNDVYRCPMKNTDDLIKNIQYSINS